MIKTKNKRKNKLKKRTKQISIHKRIKNRNSENDFLTKTLFSKEINYDNQNSLIAPYIDDYFFGKSGDNTYQFGDGYDVIDYSYLPSSISLVRGGTVNKGSLGTDTFLDFYDKIIATNNLDDWIDGITNGGFIADLEINLSKNYLSINNLPGIGSISSFIEKFENISGSNNADRLIGNSSNNTILGNKGNDNIFGKKGNDTIYGGEGNDFLNGGKGNDEIYGNSGNDLIKGGLGRDMLKGGKGEDIFIYENSKESKLTTKSKNSNIDWIKDFDVNNDKISFAKGVEQESFLFLGDLDFLTSNCINNALKESCYLDFDTIGFNLKDQQKTFIAINGSKSGFQLNRDLVVEITGFSGNLENINIINNQSHNDWLIG